MSIPLAFCWHCICESLLSCSRFTLLTKTGIPCTALAFSLCRKNEVLVASGDCSLRCYDSGILNYTFAKYGHVILHEQAIYVILAERKELVSVMKDHESSICSISIHASGRHALTTANEIAQIWDLDTFTKKKTLNGAQTVGIQQVTDILQISTMTSLWWRWRHDDVMVMMTSWWRRWRHGDDDVMVTMTSRWRRWRHDDDVDVQIWCHDI